MRSRRKKNETKYFISGTMFWFNFWFMNLQFRFIKFRLAKLLNLLSLISLAFRKCFYTLLTTCVLISNKKMRNIVIVMQRCRRTFLQERCYWCSSKWLKPHICTIDRIWQKRSCNDVERKRNEKTLPTFFFLFLNT